MSKVRKDGTTKRQHLEAGVKAGGKEGELAALELAGPEVPEEGRYVWAWYTEIATGDAVSHTEIESWARLTRRMPEPWEVELLRAIDAAWLAERGGAAE